MKQEPYIKFRTEIKIYNFERVKYFEYLGITVYDNEEELEIDKRMTKGS
jgi:hypothetical protein